MEKHILNSIKIEGFRNLADAKLEFCDGINTFYGDNGQGKTNLLETVWLLAGGKSFRGSKDQEMINFDKDFFRIEADTGVGGLKNQIVIYCSKVEHEYARRVGKINGGEFSSCSDLAGKFSRVLFTPSHMSVLTGAPELRRKFVDGCLCQMSPTFLKNYRELKKALDVRNEFLKEYYSLSRLEQSVNFESYDNYVAQHSNEVREKRQELCTLLSVKAREYYRQISGGKEELNIRYRRLADDQFGYKRLLNKYRQRDLALGYTTIGAQREDIEITLDGRPAKDYGSQGQQRSVVIAMKLAECDVVEAFTGKKPVILLDDVLSELDYKRQDYLLNKIQDRQVFITSCDYQRIKDGRGKKFQISRGEVECM